MRRAAAAAARGRRWLRRRRPHDEWAFDDYKAEFPATAGSFGAFVDAFDAVDLGAGDGPAAAVMVFPWVATPLPWYSIALAYALRRRGRRVSVVWDDGDFSGTVPSTAAQNAVIEPVIRRVGAHLPVVRLGDRPAGAPRAEDRAVVERLARVNELWRLRGGVPTPRDHALRAEVADELDATLRRLRGLLDAEAFDVVVVPGGLWGPSGAMVAAAAAAGVRVVTFDAGIGWFLGNTRGPAAHQDDVADAFRLLWDGGPETVAPLIREGRREFDDRLVASDRTRFQVVGRSGTAPAFPVDLLVPMNVDHDAAALDRHRWFADTTDWITRTVSFVVDETDRHVVIRQHPSERKALERGRLDIGGVIAQRFGAHPRVHFVAAEDPVSTYDLLDAARVVSPFVSTIGIEAAARGAPVVPAGAAYYSDLGFVHAPTSQESYFALLRAGLADGLPPLAEQSERAWLCYYLSQCCNRVWSDFTPQPADFPKWVGGDPVEVLDRPEVVDLLTSIDDDVPLSWVRHRRAAARGALGPPGDGPPG